MEQDLTRYNEIKENIFNIFLFLIQKRMYSKNSGKARGSRHPNKEYKQWKASVMEQIAPLIQEFKEESLRVFGEEYGITKLWSAAASKASKTYYKAKRDATATR